MSTKLINPKKGDKFRASQLDYSDIGKEVRIKLESGATVTDRLARFYTGLQGFNRPVSELYVGFTNVFPSSEHQPAGNCFRVDPDALVVVIKLAEVRA